MWQLDCETEISNLDVIFSFRYVVNQNVIQLYVAMNNVARVQEIQNQ